MGHPPSMEKAIYHFKYRVLPRRLRDTEQEEWFYRQYNVRRKFYRKLSSIEINSSSQNLHSSETYPLCVGLDAYAHFGLGTGIYFLQIIGLAVVMFIGGSILIPNMIAFDTNTDWFISFTGACSNEVNVTLVDGSIGVHRDCHFTLRAGECDLIMCLVICAAFFFFKYVEDKMEAKLDESVQTAQDYSVMVDDPSAAITNPDDWYQYFSRWGEVKYVSVIRKNSQLCHLLLERHLLVREIEGIFPEKDKEQMIKIAETSDGIVLQEPTVFGTTHMQKYVLKLRNINEKLDEAYKMVFPVIKVFITFELEQDQRYCLEALSTSYFDSAIEYPPNDDEDDIEKKYVPRIEDDVLCVREPSEPDNINWQTLEISIMERFAKNFLSLCIGLVALYGSFYFTNWVQENNPEYFPLAIAVMDTILPSIFQIILLIEKHIDEDDRQNSLLRILFFGRILNPIVMPFLLTPWNDFVTSVTVNSILQIQISTCFTSLVVQALDIPGLLDRHINGPIFAKTQTELNGFYGGSPWILAERYSNVGKILFVSLLYSFITPIALYLAAFAFILIFIVDNYMLFRRWMPAPMLDPSMAKRVRQMGMIALSVHMYVTGRFIYSWPMDNTAFDPNQGGYVRIDARPPLRILDLYVQWWHNDAQSRILVIYKTATIVVFVATFIVCLGETIYDTLMFLFVDSSEEKRSNTVGVPYSALRYVASYCPTISNGNEKYLCTDTSMMKPRHFPPTFSNKNQDQVDLGLQIPPHIRPQVLSVNKYYESSYDRKKRSNIGSIDENKDENEGDIKKDKHLARLKKEGVYYNTISQPQGDEEAMMNDTSNSTEHNDEKQCVLPGFSFLQRKKNKENRIEPQTDASKGGEEVVQKQEDASDIEGGGEGPIDSPYDKKDENGNNIELSGDDAIKRDKYMAKLRQGKIILPPLEVDASDVKKKKKVDNADTVIVAPTPSCTADTLSSEEHNILSKWRREIIRSECTDPKLAQRKLKKKKGSAKVDHSLLRRTTDAIDFEEFVKTTEDLYAGRGLFVSHEDKELDKFMKTYDKSTRQGPSRRTLIRLYNKLMRIQKEEWKLVQGTLHEDETFLDKDESLIYGFLQAWIPGRKF